MLLECLDDSLVGRLSLANSLGVAWSGVVKLDPPFLAEVLELKANELRAVIGENLLWYAEAAYDILPDEVLNFAVRDLMKGLSFNPLGEVVSNREHVNPLARGQWEFVDDVHPPFHEWPWGGDGSKLLRWKVCHLGEALVAVAPLDK